MSRDVHTGGGRSREPQRTCVGCRQKAAQAQLVRLVRSPEGEVVVDHPHRLGGRGAYVCSSVTCVSSALRSKRLSQLVGGPVSPLEPDVLREQIVERVSQRVIGLLASSMLGHKAAIGAVNAEAALRSGSKMVVVASDASARVRRDLEAVIVETSASIMEFGDRAQLGLAFGRSLVAAVALTDDGLARAVHHELKMLRGLEDARGTTRTISQRETMALERAT